MHSNKDLANDPDEQIDVLCDAFEQEWLDDRQPSIEDYIARVGHHSRRQLLGELLGIELELRRKAGDEPKLKDYGSRFPADVELILGEWKTPDRVEVSDSIPRDIFEAIEPHCKRFGEGWSQGADPDIADFLGKVAERDRPWLFHELLRIELMYRRRRGEKPMPADYQNRFWDKAILIDTVFKANDPTAHDLSTTPPTLERDVEHTGPMRGPTAVLPPAGASFGDFELIELLGEGGMGVVYRARQQAVQREVALKLIRSDRLGPSGSEQRQMVVRRFLSERELAAQLEHEHIVRVYEVGELDDQPFLVMQFVSGTSLHERLRDGPMNVVEAARLLRPMADAVGLAHQKDIVHRDIKPRNILLDEDGKPYLADFGLAKSLEVDEGLTESGELLGTASYMSPEQAAGRQVGPASDVYSLGATLYEMVAGRPPFKAANLVATMRQVLDDEPVSPRRLNPAVSRDVETICLKCLEKDPRNRYGTADALADDLGHVQAGEPISARPVSRPERLWRWSKRNPRLAGWSGAASLLALVLAIGGPIATTIIHQQKEVAVEARAVALAAQARAEGQREIGVESLRKLVYAAHPALEHQPGMQDLRERIINIAVGGLEEIIEMNQNDEKEAVLLASSFRKLGAFCLEVGESDRALVFYQRGLDIANRLDEENRLPDPDMNFAHLNEDLGEAHRRRGNADKAKGFFLKMLAHREKRYEKSPDSKFARDDVAKAHMRLYSACLMLGDLEEAGEHLQKNWDVLDADPERQVSDRERAGRYFYLSEQCLNVGKPMVARKFSTECLKSLNAAAIANPQAPNIHFDLALKYSWAGYVLLTNGDLQEAGQHYLEAIDQLETLRDKSPRNARMTRELASAQYGMGNTLVQANRRQEARRHYNQALDLRKQLAEKDSAAEKQAEYMLALVRCSQLDEAGEIAARLRANHPDNALILVYVACAEALTAETIDRAIDVEGESGVSPSDGRTSAVHYRNALGLVRAAIEKGFKLYFLLRNDPDLRPLQGRPDFVELLERAEAGELQPASE